MLKIHLLLFLSFLPFAFARNAYVTLLYGDSYVLPARILMHSLKSVTPQLDGDRVVIGANLSATATSQLRSDGILVHPVPPLSTPYTNHSKYRARFNHVLTKLYIFNLTQYSSVLFLDADSLVLRPLTSIFNCGQFCATFINPCHFNAGLLKVTPNATLFRALTASVASTPSYDGGDQGFLNSFYPNMLAAPFYDPENPQTPPPPFARLPFDFHTDHSALFPTGAFEFQKSNRCGQPKHLEWLGPPAAKPWQWWTYPVFDLSWTWNDVRRKLTDKYPPGSRARLHGFLLSIMSYWVVAVVMMVMRREGFRSFMARCSPFRYSGGRYRVLLPVLTGFSMWVVLFATCVWIVPPILMPFEATAVFLHIRIAVSFLLLMLGGWVCCGAQKRTSDQDEFVVFKNVDQAEILRIEGVCWRWTLLDATFLIFADIAMWQWPWRGMWARGMFVMSMVVAQLALVMVMFGEVYGRWMRLSRGRQTDIEDLGYVHPSKWRQ